MLLLLLQFLGRIAAHSPEGLLRLLSHGLGDGIFLLLPRRRRLILSNLHHAFPERDEAWRRRLGRESCRRLVETGLLSLALPYLGPERLRRIVRAGPELLALHARHREDPAPTLICSPHLAHWEVQTAQPLVVPGAFPEFGIIYRPLDAPAADRFVRAARERFGMRLLSRKEGFAEALKILRRRGFVGILFDQNAGLQGALTTLFGRVCATTELPGLLAEKFGARVYGIYPRRHGFWRVEIGAFQDLMDKLYGETDRERGIPSTIAWLCEETGELAQAVRKGTEDQQLHELGDVLAGLASLANQLGLSLEDAARRYVDNPP